MTLVTDSGGLLRDFEDLDCCTLEQLQKAINAKRYQLIERDTQVMYAGPEFISWHAY